LRRFGELDLIVLLLTLVMPFLSAVIMNLLGWEISQFNRAGSITLAMVWQGLLVLAIMFALSIALGVFWLGSRWVSAAALFWAIELLFFTTFLTNGQGVATGLIGSLGYWIDQQEVMRGGQPWYYFYLIAPLYEFLPWLLSIGGMAAWALSRGRQPASEAATEETAARRGASERRALGADLTAQRSSRRVQSALRSVDLRGVPGVSPDGDVACLYVGGREDAVAHDLPRDVHGSAGRVVAGAGHRRDRLA
jgi:hypothetical protein